MKLPICMGILVWATRTTERHENRGVAIREREIPRTWWWRRRRRKKKRKPKMYGMANSTLWRLRIR